VEIARPPVKHRFSPHRFFFCEDRRIEVWESAGKRLWTVFRAMI
jgi:hypothetical protein